MGIEKMNTTKQKYNPQSHFFVNAEALIMADGKYKSTDAYGPVLGEEETKYRVTSFVRTDRVTEVYAICDGEILIQPQENNNDKINLILKPSTGTYAPLRIKYFVYRGVRKSDLIWDDKYLCPVDANIDSIDTMAQPQLLKNLWKEFCEMDAPNSDVLFPLSLIGYDQPENTRLDEMFSGNEDFQLPTCKAGMHIGYFEGKIGLDIVLDDGDLIPEFGRELFKLDLQYARKEECVFNLNDITDNNETLQNTYRKRYKENILKFIDAAAFWGSHIEFGNIQKNNNETFNSAEDIYNVFLNKYQTANTVYVQITNEYGRSFSYYNGSEEKVHIELTDESIMLYEEQIEYSDFGTNGWPIACLNGNIGEKYLFIQLRRIKIFGDYTMYGINFELDKDKSSVVYYCSFFSKKISYYNNIITSNFFQMSIVRETDNVLPINRLWRTGLKSFLKKHFVIGSYGYPTALHLDNSNNSNNPYIPDIPDVYKKTIVFDIGENKSSEKKGRQLYIAQKIENTSNTSEITSLYENNIKYETYLGHLYGGNNIIKDAFFDKKEKIYSLTLYNKTPYYQLGITEDEYENLTLGNNGFPREEVDNIFFYLTEVSTEGISDNKVKKYELGIRFEDGTGQMKEAIYPSIPIYVYTIDEHYFFTKEYSNYQHLYYKKLGAMFYPTENYDGEFGFDWIRDGETGYEWDKPYVENIGCDCVLRDKQYYPIIYSTEEEDIDNSKITYSFKQSPESFVKLTKEFEKFFVHFDEDCRKYYIPQITLYPYCDSSTQQEPKGDFQFRTVFNISKESYHYETNRGAMLSLKITNYTNAEQIKIGLKYDSSLFNIEVLDQNQNSIDMDNCIVSWGITIFQVTIKCLKEFSVDTYINVVRTDKDTDETIGMLQCVANDSSVRKKIKIVMINIKMNDANSYLSSNDITSIAASIKKYLRQFYITPYFDIRELDLSVNSNINNFIVTGRLNDIPYDCIYSQNESLTSFLGTQICEQMNVPIQDFFDESYFKLYCFNYRGASKKDNEYVATLIGKSWGTSSVFFFKNKKDDVTPAHEILHSLGVPHSFDEKSQYQFRKEMTSNIMDYSEIRKSLWFWQKKYHIINSKLENDED